MTMPKLSMCVYVYIIVHAYLHVHVLPYFVWDTTCTGLCCWVWYNEVDLSGQKGWSIEDKAVHRQQRISCYMYLHGTWHVV